jgi:hypothetical protein
MFTHQLNAIDSDNGGTTLQEQVEFDLPKGSIFSAARSPGSPAEPGFFGPARGMGWGGNPLTLLARIFAVKKVRSVTPVME